MDLTTKAQEALQAAIRDAAASGHAQVEPAHLLLALAGQPDTTTGPLLDATGASARSAAQAAATATSAEWSIDGGGSASPGGATSPPGHFGSLFLRFDAYQGVSSISDYSKAAITPSLDASAFSTAMFLNFNLVNDGFTGAGGPNNAFEVWYIDNTAAVPTWTQIFTVQENGQSQPEVTSESINLGVLLGVSDFQLAFVVEGESTLGIDEWIVDNISVADEVRVNNGSSGSSDGGGDDGGCSTGTDTNLLVLIALLGIVAVAFRVHGSRA